ncbi:hypothetical protein BD289DRAFT_427221 [Coniella lustricola]|uniref:Secreted protein n=1 Tax=Coniella lustricola TaxID=2025994 RepID=A0A2T3AFH4_9PEZI|nr:hypothetical protein BD289DRAFT_427221 [Coniella lustricola]
MTILTLTLLAKSHSGAVPSTTARTWQRYLSRRHSNRISDEEKDTPPKKDQCHVCDLDDGSMNQEVPSFYSHSLPTRWTWGTKCGAVKTPLTSWLLTRLCRLRAGWVSPVSSLGESQQSDVVAWVFQGCSSLRLNSSIHRTGWTAVYTPGTQRPCICM